MRRIGENNIALDARQLAGHRLQQGHECQVDEQHAVLSMIDDPDDLLGKQPRVDCVVNSPDAGDAVPAFKMAPGVPGQRRNTVARLDALARQPLRHLECAPTNIGIGGAVDGAFERTRHHLARTMLARGMVDDLVQQQGPVLHLAKHRDLPVCRFVAAVRAVFSHAIRAQGKNQSRKNTFDTAEKLLHH